MLWDHRRWSNRRYAAHDCTRGLLTPKPNMFLVKNATEQ